MAPGDNLKKIRAAWQKRMEEMRDSATEQLDQLRAGGISPDSNEELFEKVLKGHLGKIEDAIKELSPKTPSSSSGT